MQQGQQKQILQTQRNDQEQPQFNAEAQFYQENLNESRAHSIVSHSSNPQNLIKFFQDYQPATDLHMADLHASPHLKLKKYKQSVYYGEFMNGKRQGQGIMIYDNKRMYEGSWQNDFKHGFGFEKFPNQCTYKGDYVNGKPEGVGRYSWPNGQFYEGQWSNGMKQGSGMWRGSKGDSYIGEWKYGKADGYGVHTWVNGDRYEGQFRQCLKHGEGIQKFNNGDIYKGLYVNGKPCGFGEYYWANGSYFKGNFKNGLRDGHGLWKRGTGNSDKYEGQYSNDKKSGYGIFTWASGNVYKGNYGNDSRDGYGEMYWNDGSFYKGQWKNGIQHGEGEIYVPGSGYKKGTFEDNVLVIVEQQSQSINYVHHDTIPHNKGIISNMSKKTSTLGPSRISIRSRGLKPKFNPKKTKSIDESIVVRYGSTNSSAQHPLLPKRFLKTKQQNSLPFHRTKQSKNRVLHSSFYMHKLHNRGSSSVKGSRAENQSRHSEAQSHQNKRTSLLGQMKNFTRKKVSEFENV